MGASTYSSLAAVAILLVGGPLSVALSQTGKREAEPKSVKADGDEPDGAKQRRAEVRKVTEQRATNMKVQLAGEHKTSGELVRAPLYNYTDQPRRIVDATLWGWTIDGRLAGICKIERKFGLDVKTGYWQICFGSLSPDLINVEWADGYRFSSKKPGIVRQPVGGALRPAENKTARIRQIKEIASRFRSTLVDEGSGQRQEMRLLTQPLYRYDSGEGNLHDGAVFGITANGTNPDAILVIEVEKSADGQPEFVFGVTGMTQQALIIALDDREVWTKPQVPGPGDYDTWTWFVTDR